MFTVQGRGRDLLASVERLDLESIVAKRLRDPYTPDVEWRKIRNDAYTQKVGRAELFHPKTRKPDWVRHRTCQAPCLTLPVPRLN